MRPLVRTVALTLLALLASWSPAPARDLGVEVWTDKGTDAVYEPGEAMRIKVRPSDDAHLIVYEIDSDGAVNLLWPLRRGSARVEGGRTLRLPSADSDLELAVNEATGQGFLVAIASDRPFRDLPWFLRPYDPQAAAIGYDSADPQAAKADEEGFDERGRVVGDPYVAMERIRRRLLDKPQDEGSFATDYATYYVHEPVRYPRYLCNDCHRPGRWAWWEGFDPYYADCSVVTFRVNWSWGWGSAMWSAHAPYYYYVVRPDCPPYYRPWYDDRSRFSSWDGWGRWNDLWGGQLRRYKPAPPPVSYTPPPSPGTVWRQGATPPGLMPDDLRERMRNVGERPARWLERDRGDGRPVWRETRETPGTTPGVRPTPTGERPGTPGANPMERWRDRQRGEDAPRGSGSVDDARRRAPGGARPSWKGGEGSGGSETPRRERVAPDTPKREAPKPDVPRNDPPVIKVPPSGPPKGTVPQGKSGSGNGQPVKG